jgi:hypothetical protein
MGRPRWGNACASIISSQIITGPKFHTNYQDEAFYGERGAQLDPDPWCLKTQVEGGETLEKVRRRGLEPGGVSTQDGVHSLAPNGLKGYSRSTQCVYAYPSIDLI